MEIKYCLRCDELKPIGDFSRNRCCKDGLQTICRDCCNKEAEEYRKKNREKLNEKQKEYQKKNKESYNEYQKKYQKERRKTDPKFRLSQSMSANINQSLKLGKNGRHWEIIVGYTIQDLIKYLEQRFQEGMNWGNYGEWHIDHVIPIAVFNFTKSEHIDFQRCWALSNLQPLWAKENKRKKDKLKLHFQPNLRL